MRIAGFIRWIAERNPRRALRQTSRRLSAWVRAVHQAGGVSRFVVYTWNRFEADDGMRLAAGLSYASLLALVPLLAIVLGMLSMFPAFGELQERVVEALLEEFLPETAAEVGERLRAFVDAASGIAGPGVVALLATALLLLANINGAFNKIWRVSEPHPLHVRFLVYWALLSLGPLLVGASVSITSLVFAEAEGLGLDEIGGWQQISWLFAILLAAVGFALLFIIVPNRRIEVVHALIGGAISALLFEFLKWGFGVYLANFPAYQVIYGAVATIPIFLLWLFLSWMAVLLGAEVAAALPEWRATRARGSEGWSAGQRLALALALLARLRLAMRSGRHLQRQEMTQNLPVTPEELDNTLADLRAAGFLARTQQGRWLIGRDLASATVDDLMRALHLSLEPGSGWPSKAEAAVRAFDRAAEPARMQSLQDALDAQERDQDRSDTAVPSVEEAPRAARVR